MTIGLLWLTMSFLRYGFRGMDMVNIVKEWGNDNAFFDRQNLYYPPEDSVLKHLLLYYYDESVRIYGQEFSDNPLNSVEHLIKELKVFWLVNQFAWALPPGKLVDENSVIPEDMLRFFGGKRPDRQQLIVIVVFDYLYMVIYIFIQRLAEHGYGLYLKLKTKLKEEKLFD